MSENRESEIKENQPEMVREDTSVKPKSLGNTTKNTTKSNVSDVVFWGNGDTFKLISKASSESEGWMKSSKAMQYANGVTLQVTTQQRNPDGSYSLAEALTNIPGAMLMTLAKNSQGQEFEFAPTEVIPKELTITSRYIN